MGRDMIEETYGIKCNFLEVMQIRNAIPWIRLGPINVQNILAGEIYVNYQGEPLNVISCSTKKLYEVCGEKTDFHFKIHEKWKRDFPEDTFDLNEWQKLYSVAFLASLVKIIHRIVPCRDYLFKGNC